MFAYRSILQERPRPVVIRENRRAPWLAVSLVGGLVSMARGIGTTFGISLMALAWHLGSQSSQAGNHGYAGTEQARPAFLVLAVAAAAAATIALASRAGAEASRPAQGGGPVRCIPLREK